MPKAEPW
ncbi:hypothetical protein quinque_000011, partial [Culex quinquefasciatus]